MTNKKKLEALMAFVEEITKADGKYTYLNDTPIVADAYKILRSVE